MEFMKVKDVMELFGVSRKTIHNWMKNNGMPYSRVGQTLRFEKSEVIEWFKNKDKEQ